jgi:hypothetical protein
MHPIKSDNYEESDAREAIEHVPKFILLMARTP